MHNLDLSFQDNASFTDISFMNDIDIDIDIADDPESSVLLKLNGSSISDYSPLQSLINKILYRFVK